jgi:Uma2 family endonuclease
MSLAEFLAWERKQELRFEFDGTDVLAMNGGTLAHSEIATNIVEALRRRLRGSPCRAFRGDVKVIVEGRVRYPDVVVTCSPGASNVDVVPEPVVVVEVLSASTAGIDRVIKNAEYRATPSISHYVMVEQTSPAATVFSRAGSDWIGRLVMGDSAIVFPNLGIELQLSEVFDGVAFSVESAD